MIHYKVRMLCARVQLDRRYNREVTAIGIQSLRSYPIREVTPRDLINGANTVRYKAYEDGNRRGTFGASVNTVRRRTAGR